MRTKLLLILVTFFSMISLNAESLQSHSNMSQESIVFLGDLDSEQDYENAQCRTGGYQCKFDSQCCSSNCFLSTCQGGANSCTFSGWRCQVDNQCCSGDCIGGIRCL